MLQLAYLLAIATPVIAVVTSVYPGNSASLSCNTGRTVCDSLSGAVTNAVSGDIVQLYGGTYTGAANRNIQWPSGLTNVTIVGSADPSNRTVFDLAGAGRFMGWVGVGDTTIVSVDAVNGAVVDDSGGTYALTSTATVMLQDCGVYGSNATDNGNGGGMLVAGGGTLTMLGGTIANCRSANGGGGIFVSGSGRLIATGVTLTGNSAAGHGGSIQCVGAGDVTLNGLTMSQGSALAGGHIEISTPFSSVTIINSTVVQGSSTLDGGCVWLSRDAPVVINNVDFNGCTAGTNGGIMSVSSAASSSANGNVINVIGGSMTGGYARAGSAVWVEDQGIVQLAGTTVSSCTSIAGGTLQTFGRGTLDLEVATVQGNLALYGGGVYIDVTGILLLVNSSISSNTAQLNGGGLYLKGAVTASGSTLSSNQAANGAAMALQGTSSLCSSFSFAGTFVTNNLAVGAGGALYYDQSAIVCGTSLNISDPSQFRLNNNVANAYGSDAATPPTAMTFVGSPVFPLVAAPGSPLNVTVRVLDALGQPVPVQVAGGALSIGLVAVAGGVGSLDTAEADYFYGWQRSLDTRIANIKGYGFPGTSLTAAVNYLPSPSQAGPPPTALTFQINVANCLPGTQLTSTDTAPQAPYYCAPCDDGFFNLDFGGLCRRCPATGVVCTAGQISVVRGFYAATYSTGGTGTMDAAQADINHTATAVGVAVQSMSAAAAVDEAEEGQYGDAPYPSPTGPIRTFVDVSPCRPGACCNAPVCALNAQCPPGRQGFQCGSCTAGYLQVGDNCVPAAQCTDTNNALVAIAIMLAVAVASGILLYAVYHECDVRLGQLLLLSHVAYFLTPTADPWLQRVTGTVALDIRELHGLLFTMSGECIGPWSDVTILAAPYAIPLAILSFLLIVALFHFAVNRGSFKSNAGMYWLAVHRAMQACVLVLINTSIRLVSCQSSLTLSSRGVRGTMLKLVAAPGVQCYSGSHLPWGVIAWIVLTLVCLVWPIWVLFGVARITGWSGAKAAPADPTAAVAFAMANGAWYAPFHGVFRATGSFLLTLRHIVLVCVLSALQFAPDKAPTVIIYFILGFATLSTALKVYDTATPPGAAALTGDITVFSALTLMSHLVTARAAALDDPDSATWADFQNFLYVVILALAALYILYTIFWTGRTVWIWEARACCDAAFGRCCCPLPAALSNHGRMSPRQVAATSAAAAPATGADKVPDWSPAKGAAAVKVANPFAAATKAAAANAAAAAAAGSSASTASTADRASFAPSAVLGTGHVHLEVLPEANAGVSAGGLPGQLDETGSASGGGLVTTATAVEPLPEAAFTGRSARVTAMK